MKKQPQLKDEKIGGPITKVLSDYLREHTTADDRADVSKETSIGPSTIRDVIYRRNNLTENNAPAIVKMVQIAIDRCTAISEDIVGLKQKLTA